MTYRTYLDYETAERIGASGTFQVISIEDDDGNDVIKALHIDSGKHYPSLDSLKADIARATGTSVDGIDIENT
ncbi:hypothetical protein LRX75_22650 [Rhizobium sp. DKSPLA3]|uniref:Uncharacterized protein n=1 Tax=Rhizobium quercicola TaxID=2901226 RepID=A0A9X1NYV4_9HYPH|nr:hypothetical protein [Rhizobium quercicola]MCD7111831.1 hypothetical protein [Rhizobium quercicola]